MKISIITVTRNSANTLSNTLRSVAEQSVKDIEHIIIDGASTDDTSEIVKSFIGNNVKFISESDNGIYDAMNKGLSLATGDIIGFLNSDDHYTDPHVLERVLSAMMEGKLDVLYGDVVFFRDHKSKSIVRHYRSNRFKPQRLAWGWMPAHPAFFMRRKIYSQIGFFRTDYLIAGDFEIMTRIFKLKNLRFKYLAEDLVMMRSGGISNSGFKNTVILNSEVLKACRENGIKTNILKILSKYLLKIYEYNPFSYLKP